MEEDEDEEEEKQLTPSRHPPEKAGQWPSAVTTPRAGPATVIPLALLRFHERPSKAGNQTDRNPSSPPRRHQEQTQEQGQRPPSFLALLGFQERQSKAAISYSSSSSKAEGEGADVDRRFEGGLAGYPEEFAGEDDGWVRDPRKRLAHRGDRRTRWLRHGGGREEAGIGEIRVLSGGEGRVRRGQVISARQETVSKW